MSILTIPDRKTPPPFQRIHRLSIPEWQETKLPNGIRVLVVPHPHKEVVKLDLVFRAGTSFQDKRLVATVTNGMLSEGTLSRTAAQLATDLDYFGSFLQQSCDFDFASLSLYSLHSFFARSLDVVGDMICNPAFSQGELANFLNKRRQAFLVDAERVRSLARRRFQASLFPNHPYGDFADLGDFDQVFPSDLAGFHQAYYRGGELLAIVAGKADREVMEALETFLGSFSGNRDLDVSVPSVDWVPPARITVPKPGSVQSAIRIGRPLVNRAHPDYPALLVLVTALGGYFGSRLMANIREDKGYTYGIGAGLLSLTGAGYLVISCETANEYVDAVLEEIHRELDRLILEPIPEDELERVRNYMLGDLVRGFDGPFQVADSLSSLHGYPLDSGHFSHLFQVIHAVTPDRLQELAARWLQPSSMFTVIAGGEK